MTVTQNSVKCCDLSVICQSAFYFVLIHILISVVKSIILVW